jgi:hypothetical protein
MTGILSRVSDGFRAMSWVDIGRRLYDAILPLQFVFFGSVLEQGRETTLTCQMLCPEGALGLIWIVTISECGPPRGMRGKATVPMRKPKSSTVANAVAMFMNRFIGCSTLSSAP